MNSKPNYQFLNFFGIGSFIKMLNKIDELTNAGLSPVWRQEGAYAYKVYWIANNQSRSGLPTEEEEME